MARTGGSMTQSEVMLGEPRVKAGPDTSFLTYRCASKPLYTPHTVDPDVYPSQSAAGAQCSTKPRYSRDQALASVPRARCLSPATAMNDYTTRLPSVEAITTIISRAVPNVSIERIRSMPYSRPQRDISVSIAGGRTLMLTLPPSSVLKLLRSEQWLVLSEALFIPWVCGNASEHASRDKRTSIQYLIEAESPRTDEMGWMNTGGGSNRSQTDHESLLKFLPRLVDHSLSGLDLGVAFNLTEPARGLPLTSLPHPLPAADRASVNNQKGQLIRRISSLRNPSSKFGPVVTVIGSPTLVNESGGGATPVASGGADSWADAFLMLFESTLRDGEDLAVTISYSLIRHHMSRLRHLLDAVTQARLVVLDAGADANVLVSRSTRSGREAESMEPSKTSDITITGLRDWSNCIFGDPLMTSVFSEDAPPDLIRGFRQLPPSFVTHASSATVPTLSGLPPDDLIEDRENSPTRLLLYECYHATVSVVKQFYRPTWPDGTRREMDARRRLATALNRLAEVDANAVKWPRTTNPDVWPAKKS